MNALCLVLRHKWRVEDINGKPYEVCARCHHYRNDADWRDVNGKPGMPVVGGGDSGPPAGW